MSEKQWRVLLKTSRPAFWIVILCTLLAGAYACRSVLTPGFMIFSVFFAIALSLFVFGTNDIYDYPTDKRNSRKGGIEGAVLKPQAHALMRRAVFFAGILILLLSIGDAFMIHNYYPLILIILLLFFAYYYSAPPLRFKEVPIVDSLSNGVMVLLLFMVGLLQGTYSLPILVKAVFLAGGVAAFHALGALADYTPDIRAGQKTIATVLGRRGTALFAFLVCCIIIFFSGIQSPIIMTLMIISAGACGVLVAYPQDKLTLFIFRSLIVLLICAAAAYVFIPLMT